MARSSRNTQPRTALVHDFLLDLRGAERVFLALCDLYPEADVFTAVYDEKGTDGRFAGRRINASFLQALRPTARSFRALLPLYPYAMERLDLSGYDLVISSSSAWAHGVIVDPGTVHVCYCHNPFRYAWSEREAVSREHGALARAGLSVIFQRWRQWDWIAAQRVDRYIANSETTRTRIGRYFNRDAPVVYPPVDVGRFATAQVGEYYLVLTELMGHKRVAVAIEAFNRMGERLVVVGDGPDARRLRRLAGPTVRFEGRVSDARAAELLAGARALVVTATEEFGIAAVEAQAAGRPVVALAEGGARETVRDGVTGRLFEGADAAALIHAVRSFDALHVDPQECVRNASRFDTAQFVRGIEQVLADACEERPSWPSGTHETHRPRRRGLAVARRP